MGNFVDVRGECKNGNRVHSAAGAADCTDGWSGAQRRVAAPARCTNADLPRSYRPGNLSM